MLRDNLVGLIEPMPNSAGAEPLALRIPEMGIGRKTLHALKIPAPKGRNLQLSVNVTSPFQAEPRHTIDGINSRASRQIAVREQNILGFAKAIDDALP